MKLRFQRWAFLCTALLILQTIKAAPDAGSITLSGIVKDSKTNLPLAGASVSIPDLRIGDITDSSGKYSIKNIPKGIYLVQVTYMGYATFLQKINFAKTTELNISLQESSIENTEVTVTGVSKATEIKRDPVPTVAVSKSYINQRAGAGNVIDERAGIPGVSAVTTGPNISKPFIHGLGYNRVVTAVDGIRQEGQQWGD
ncbi:MAG: carboxypeptidase-like regulatory domain-containing protein, partial [Chitinophagaceae bacterium]|nr:carboxypeptidase-like regulatory domain-containing protein [Chitinophagaceae bacterium]